tara:strand:- start:1106 stop:1273 length:168 start_codon:yes stop_codon:yes gene_type:complete
MKDEEFDWSAYKDKVVEERVKQFNTIEDAVVEMDAIIASLKVELAALQEMVTWDE